MERKNFSTIWGRNTCVLLWFMLSVQFIFIEGMDNGFTFLLGARKRECFYETLKVNTSLDLEYQVIEGGELDINFEVRDPNGDQIVYTERSSEETHELTVKVPGVYRFCADNSFSSITDKMVYLDLGIMKEEYDPDKTRGIDGVMDVYTNLEVIRIKLDKVSSYQGAMRAKEARQRYYVEGNHSRVMWLSCIASVVMVTVGMLQVYFVRHLFDDRGRSRI